MTVGLLVGWGLVAVGLSWGLLRLLLWDTEGVSPDARETLTPSQRQRVEAMKDAEGEALPPCRCSHVAGHPTHCYPDRCYGVSRDTVKHGGGL